jgi:hypothetical protein
MRSRPVYRVWERLQRLVLLIWRTSDWLVGLKDFWLTFLVTTRKLSSTNIIGLVSRSYGFFAINSGIYLVYLLYIHGIYHVNGIYMVLYTAWIIPSIYLLYSKYIHGITLYMLWYTFDNTSICNVYTLHIHCICLEYTMYNMCIYSTLWLMLLRRTGSTKTLS